MKAWCEFAPVCEGRVKFRTIPKVHLRCIKARPAKMSQPFEAQRIIELKEECGLTANKLKNIGFLKFEFEGDPKLLEVHVFETYEYHGDVTESEEMLPKWYNLRDIPFENMWLDDKLWFPYMFRGDFFKGYFLYRGEDVILKYDLQVVDELPKNHNA